MAERDTTRTRSADDVTGGQEAYIEAIRRAEQAAEVVEVETPSPLPADATPVQASDQPLLPEAEPAEPVAETPAEPEAETEQTPAEEAVEQLLAGKYKNVDELEAAHLELQSVLGRQGQEVGELRQAFDALSAQLAAQNAAALAPGPVQITQDLIDANPGYATVQAYEQKNEAALQIAFDAWKLEDEGTAITWLNDKKLEQQEAKFQQELSAVREEMKTLSKPQAEAAERDTWNEAFKLVSANHPDFVGNAARILEEVAPNYPAILGTLATGDAKAKAEILTALYAIDRNGNPEQVAAQLKEAADAAAREAEANRNGASVVTQATVGVGAAVELTANEEEQERYKRRMSSGPSLERGWTGRS